MATHPSPILGEEPDLAFLTARINRLNRRRITWVLAIFAGVHLVHLILFWPYTPGPTVNADVWRNGVLVIHAALTTFIAVVLPLNMLLDHTKRISGIVLGAIPELVSLVYLFGGAALAIIDQRVTSSINPLLAAALGVASVIIIRPVVAVINYALVLAFFVIGVAWTQADSNLLLSIRVNSLTAIGLGCTLALIQWRNQVVSLRQQHQIEAQQRELEEKNRELTLLATRDSLTGLLNRTQFIPNFNREVARLQRVGCTASLIMMDVDDFKHINDSLGHPAGDSILLEVAGRLTRILRRTDLLARFGGEEFAILLPLASVPESVQIAEKLRLAIAQEPFAVGDRAIRITASFGVAACPTTSADAFDQSYNAVDLALYQAKRDGRNCVRSAAGV